LRRRERGYNQSELLARALGQRGKIPVRDVLTRVRHTTTQTHYDRKQRMKNLRKAFAMRKNQSVEGATIILVDDVLTTGSTLDECARVLMQAGSGPVYALAIGRG
jgi:ComF family protein